MEMSEEQTEPDLGHAVHYNAVPEGATVYDRDNGALGTVRQIVDNYREHILDGVVVAGQDGVVRFVDGPEVGRTFERGVLLTISAAEFAEHGPLFGRPTSAEELFENRPRIAHHR